MQVHCFSVTGISIKIGNRKNAKQKEIPVVTNNKTFVNVKSSEIRFVNPH